MRYILLSLLLLASSCASWIPPAVGKNDDGSITLSTTGNMFAKKEDMKSKLDKKAASLCDGKGFQYLDKGTGTIGQEPNYVTGSYQSYQRLEITIVCN